MAGQTVRSGSWLILIFCIHAVYLKSVYPYQQWESTFDTHVCVGGMFTVDSSQAKHFLVVVNLVRVEYKWTISHWHHRPITALNGNSFYIHERSRCLAVLVWPYLDFQTPSGALYVPVQYATKVFDICCGKVITFGVAWSLLIGLCKLCQIQQQKSFLNYKGQQCPMSRSYIWRSMFW